jgi:sugar lactone lactonase YvrE
MTTATLLVDSRCTLGEGIVWWAQRQALLWTDIDGARLWMHRPEGAVTTTWTLRDRLGCLAVCASGRLLLGFAKGLFVADLHAAPDGGVLEVTPVIPVEPDLPTRINDGRTDRSGNFVFGTMHEEEPKRPIGSFYQYSRRHGLRRLDLERAAIPNSICFSPDGGTMYFCDSTRRRIMQCEYDAENAAVSHVRLFAEVAPGPGSPDGSVIDREGCLWNAEWGSARVRRYAIDGTPIHSLAVPSKNPSCVAFGGPSLDELFITTARQDSSAEELDATPQAGGIYTAVVSVGGLLDPVFSDL